MHPFGSVALDWQDETVWVIGGGPSLRGFDFERLRGKGKVIAVNKAMFLIPWADVGFTLDQHFCRKHRNDMVDYAAGGGLPFLALPPNEDGHKSIPGGVYIIRRRNPGLSKNPLDCYGVNSGYGALNLAFLSGSKRINLLGFDFDYDRDGQTHWHDGYEWHSKQNHKFYQRWTTAFDMASDQLRDAGVEVTNYTDEKTGSKVVQFPIKHYAEI